MSAMSSQPHWSEWLVPTLLVIALVVCGGVFIYLLGVVIRFVAPFL
jgi:hypothetical protein